MLPVASGLIIAFTVVCQDHWSWFIPAVAHVLGCLQPSRSKTARTVPSLQQAAAFLPPATANSRWTPLTLALHSANHQGRHRMCGPVPKCLQNPRVLSSLGRCTTDQSLARRLTRPLPSHSHLSPPATATRHPVLPEPCSLPPAPMHPSRSALTTYRLARGRQAHELASTHELDTKPHQARVLSTGIAPHVQLQPPPHRPEPPFEPAPLPWRHAPAAHACAGARPPARASTRPAPRPPTRCSAVAPRPAAARRAVQGGDRCAPPPWLPPNQVRQQRSSAAARPDARRPFVLHAGQPRPQTRPLAAPRPPAAHCAA